MSNSEKWLEIEDLEKTEKNYTFSENCIPQLRNATKVALLVEHLLAEKGAGKARKCPKHIAVALQKEVGKHIQENGLPEKNYGENNDQQLLHKWTARVEKFLEKQEIKKTHYGLNLTNIPFAAGPSDIVKFVERELECEDVGIVKAIDPWWAKKGWVHDGGVTIYLEKNYAESLLEHGANGLIFDPNVPALNRKVKITPGKDGKLKNRVESDPYDL